MTTLQQAIKIADSGPLKDLLIKALYINDDEGCIEAVNYVIQNTSNEALRSILGRFKFETTFLAMLNELTTNFCIAKAEMFERVFTMQFPELSYWHEMPISEEKYVRMENTFEEWF